MALKNVALKTKSPNAPTSAKSTGGIELYLKRIFALMFGAVAVTALASYMTIWGGWFVYLINLHCKLVDLHGCIMCYCLAGWHWPYGPRFARSVLNPRPGHCY